MFVSERLLLSCIVLCCDNICSNYTESVGCKVLRKTLCPIFVVFPYLAWFKMFSRFVRFSSANKMRSWQISHLSWHCASVNGWGSTYSTLFYITDDKLSASTWYLHGCGDTINWIRIHMYNAVHFADLLFCTCSSQTTARNNILQWLLSCLQLIMPLKCNAVAKALATNHLTQQI
jgi:hypothetical protein